MTDEPIDLDVIRHQNRDSVVAQVLCDEIERLRTELVDVFNALQIMDRPVSDLSAEVQAIIDQRDTLQARIDGARDIDTKDAADAPLWMQGDEAGAWSDGWNACKWEHDRVLTGEAS